MAAKAPPPPPPLPPSPKPVTTSSGSATETPPARLDSLALSNPAESLERPPIEKQLVEQPYRPTYYFFYGTLTRPEILSHILDLEQQPILRPAKLTGYALADWGQYRALVEGEPGQEVAGYAYLVQSIEDGLRLARYETDAYEAVPCDIRFTDGQEPAREHGMVFRYAGDDEALKAGRFDRKLWELRMGARLPGRWRARGSNPPGPGGGGVMGFRCAMRQ